MKPKPILDENGLPIADPPEREDGERESKPMKRMGLPSAWTIMGQQVGAGSTL